MKYKKLANLICILLFYSCPRGIYVLQMTYKITKRTLETKKKYKQ